jgi:integrase
MKGVTNSEILVAIVNGASITPELARVSTKKREGHLLSLRVCVNRQVLAYLATELYVPPALFNSKTKQLVEPMMNEQLKSLLSRASKLVTASLNPERLKKSWAQEVATWRQEQVPKRVEVHELSGLRIRREALEQQLQQVVLELSTLEKTHGVGVPPGPVRVSQVDVAAYEQAIARFMLTLKGRAQRDQDAFNWVWTNLTKYAEYVGTTLTLQSFDYQFYLSYANFCLHVTNNFDNFFGAKVKKIKQFLKYAEGEGYVVNQGYKDKRFKILDEKKEIVYLSDRELDLIWNYKQVKPARAKTIDCILFQSLTGLRVGDALSEHTIVEKDNERFVTGICQKNKGVFLIPLSLDERIEQILEAHKYNMRLLSQAVYNRQLKLVLREVYEHHALKMPRVTYYRYKMGKPHKFTDDKAELISSHSMRRGFCTRHLNSGHFNETDVLKMLGSKDMDELQRYILVESSSLAQKGRTSRSARGSSALLTNDGNYRAL